MDVDLSLPFVVTLFERVARHFGSSAKVRMDRAIILLRNIFRQFCAQKSFIRSVLEQARTRLGHAGQQFRPSGSIRGPR